VSDNTVLMKFEQVSSCIETVAAVRGAEKDQ
jgi:hypothetical protein